LKTMHRTAGGIALRVLGENTPRTRRTVSRWASEIPPEDRPFPIYKDGRTIYAFEADIAGAAELRGAAAEAAPGRKQPTNRGVKDQTPAPSISS